MTKYVARWKIHPSFRCPSPAPWLSMSGSEFYSASHPPGRAQPWEVSWFRLRSLLSPTNRSDKGLGTWCHRQSAGPLPCARPRPWTMDSHSEKTWALHLHWTCCSVAQHLKLDVAHGLHCVWIGVPAISVPYDPLCFAQVRMPCTTIKNYEHATSREKCQPGHPPCRLWPRASWLDPLWEILLVALLHCSWPSLLQHLWCVDGPPRPGYAWDQVGQQWIAMVQRNSVHLLLSLWVLHVRRSIAYEYATCSATGKTWRPDCMAHCTYLFIAQERFVSVLVALAAKHDVTASSMPPGEIPSACNIAPRWQMSSRLSQPELTSQRSGIAFRKQIFHHKRPSSKVTVKSFLWKEG